MERSKPYGNGGYTKKREDGKKKSKKANVKEESGNVSESGGSICFVKIGKISEGRTGYFQYDTGTSHHTTN